MAMTAEQRLATKVGAMALENPLIAAPAEHFLEPAVLSCAADCYSSRQANPPWISTAKFRRR
jgi:hypothetical protein